MTTYRDLITEKYPELIKKNRKRLCAHCTERDEKKKCKHRPNGTPLLPVTIEGKDCPYHRPKPPVEQVHEEIFDEE